MEILDLEQILEFYNRNIELAGGTKRYEMNDEFYTAVLSHISESIEENHDIVMAEA